MVKSVFSLLRIAALALFFGAIESGASEVTGAVEEIKAIEKSAEKINESVGRDRVGVHVGAYPTLQYTSDDGLRVGGFSRIFNYGKEGVLPFKSLTTIAAGYAEKGTSFVWLKFQKKSVTSWKLRTDSEMYYTTSDNQRYYGVGDQTVLNLDDEAAGKNFYKFEQVNIFQNFRKELDDSWESLFGLEYAVLRSNSNGAGTLFEDDFGTDEQTFNGLIWGLGIIRDRRNSEFIATRGYLLSVKVDYSPAFLSNQEEWSRGDLDLRYYYPILPNRKLWVATQFRYTASTPSTPLVRKATLGSAETLRGLRLNRFLSNQSVSLRGGLRSIFIRRRVFSYPLKMGAGVFVDSGKVGDRFSRLASGKTHISYGITLFSSYFTDDFLGHADIGFSEETTSLYLGLGHVF